MRQVLKFSANWCQPCKMLAPAYASFIEAYPDIEFQSIDVEEDRELTEQFSIKSVPTVVFLKDGVEVKRLVGVQSKITYIETLDTL